MKITTIDIDLVKEVLQIHGEDAHGKEVLQKQFEAERHGAVPCAAGDLPGRHGSLWWCASLGEETWRIWAHGQVDGAAIRETVCKNG